MLIEAHGEAQDVAPETLAHAFLAVLEARKACNEGQVEAAISFMKAFRSVPECRAGNKSAAVPLWQNRRDRECRRRPKLQRPATAVFLGGVVSGVSAFAFPVVAGAILLHIFEPIAAVPLMMFCSIASQTMSFITVHRLIRWREIAPLLIGGIAGAAVAVPFLAVVEPRPFRIGFGVRLAKLRALYADAAMDRSPDPRRSLRNPCRCRIYRRGSRGPYCDAGRASSSSGASWTGYPKRANARWCNHSSSRSRFLPSGYWAFNRRDRPRSVSTSPGGASGCGNLYIHRCHDVREGERPIFPLPRAVHHLASGCLMAFWARR